MENPNTTIINQNEDEVNDIETDNYSVNVEDTSEEENMIKDINDEMAYYIFEQQMNMIYNDSEDFDDSAYENRYNDFEKYLDNSDYTTNYGENDEGDYDNW